MKTISLLLSTFIILSICSPLADSQGAFDVRSRAPPAGQPPNVPSGGSTFAKSATLSPGWDVYSEPLSSGKVLWDVQNYAIYVSKLVVTFELNGASPNHEYIVGAHFFDPGGSGQLPGVCQFFGKKINCDRGPLTREGTTATGLGAWDFGVLDTNENGYAQAQFDLTPPPGTYYLQFTVRIGNECTPSAGITSGCSVAYRTGNKMGQGLETVTIPDYGLRPEGSPIDRTPSPPVPSGGSSFTYAPPGSEGHPTLYSEENFNGYGFQIPHSIPQLDYLNDAVTSIQVPDGFMVKLYEDINYGGKSKSFTSGNYPYVGSDFDNIASSVELSDLRGMTEEGKGATIKTAPAGCGSGPACPSGSFCYNGICKVTDCSNDPAKACQQNYVCQNGQCVQKAATCAKLGESCTPEYWGQPGPYCCKSNLFCLHTHCTACIPHGSEVPKGGTQICCTPGEIPVLDSQGKVVCDVSGGDLPK